MRGAVRQVQLVGQLVVLAVNTYHLQQVDIGRTCRHKTVDYRIALKQVVHQQRVGSRDVSMNRIVVDAIAVGIVVPVLSSSHLVIKPPGGIVVSLDGWLHGQRTAQYVPTRHAVQALNVLLGIGDTHTILTGVRVDETGAELDELSFHRIVYTGCETLVVRSGTLEGSFLLEIVQTHIISIIGTAATQVDVVVLTDTCLKHLLEPVGVGIVLEMILAVLTQLVAAGKRCSGIGAGLTQELAVLVGVHQVVHTAGNPVNTKVALVVNFQRLILLTVLRGDDDHAVSGS